MVTTEPSSSGHLRSSRVRVSPVSSGRLVCICVAALLDSLLWGPAAIAATPAPTATELQDTIGRLEACVAGDAKSRPVCSQQALQTILSSDMRPPETDKCIKKDPVSSGGYVVNNATACIAWLQSLKGAETMGAELVTTKPANAAISLGPDPSRASSDTSLRASAVPASGAQQMLPWITIGIVLVLLAALIIGYLTFREAKAALEKLVEDRDRELAKLAKDSQQLQEFREVNALLEARVGDRDRKLAKLANDNQQLQDALILARSEVPAHKSILKRDPLTDARPAAEVSTAVAEAAPRPVSRPTAVSATDPAEANISKAVVQDSAAPIPERQAPSREAVQNAILNAIASLANERSSLTEANFVNKVAGFVADATIKAILLADLEPALFFLANGARSPQGPELVVYRLKGSPNHCVVPYPSAGRVGQFNRWFENAESPYGVSPVLASKAAVGVIGADGNVSVSSLGILT